MGLMAHQCIGPMVGEWGGLVTWSVSPLACSATTSMGSQHLEFAFFKRSMTSIFASPTSLLI